MHKTQVLTEKKIKIVFTVVLVLFSISVWGMQTTLSMELWNRYTLERESDKITQNEVSSNFVGIFPIHFNRRKP